MLSMWPGESTVTVNEQTDLLEILEKSITQNVISYEIIHQMILTYRKGMNYFLSHDPSKKWCRLSPGLIHDLFLPYQNISFWLLFYSLFILLSTDYHCFKSFGLYMWETLYNYISIFNLSYKRKWMPQS